MAPEPEIADQAASDAWRGMVADKVGH